MRKLIAVLLAASFLVGAAEAAAAASKRPPVKSPCIDLPPERQARRSSRDLQGLFRPDPPDRWRRIGVDRRNSTSDCIGDPVTPACAIDTMMAAFVARDIELYRLVYPSLAKELAFTWTMDNQARRIEPSDVVYRFHQVADLAAENAPRKTQPRQATPPKADQVEVVTEELSCHLPDFVIRSGYFLRRSETGWRIIGDFIPDRR